MADAVVSGRASAVLRMLPGKGRAAGIHVSISLVIFLALLYVIAVKWFPQPYFRADGGWQGIRLMFFVDVVLGPLLTFVVFNPSKPRREIVADLSLVALVQLTALVWGGYTVYGERPVAIVEWDGTLQSVIAEPFEARDIDLATLSAYDHRKPPVIFQRVPEGEELRKSFTLSNVEGWPRSAQTFLYERFQDRLPQVFEHAAAFEIRITEKFPALEAEFARLREARGADIVFLPFDGRYSKVIVAISRQGELLTSTSMPR